MTLTELKKSFKENVEEVRKTYPTYADEYIAEMFSVIVGNFNLSSIDFSDDFEDNEVELDTIEKDFEESKCVHIFS